MYPGYFPVILRTDVQSNLMEHLRHVKEAVKTDIKGAIIYAAYSQMNIIKISISKV